VLPDLRYSQTLANPKAWNSIVRNGVLENRGMVSFASEYTLAQTEAIRAYVIHRANQDAAKQRSRTGQ
jgi:quinohemoprotein ethanol dehydrogenase